MFPDGVRKPCWKPPACASSLPAPSNATVTATRTKWSCPASIRSDISGADASTRVAGDQEIPAGTKWILMTGV
jgi:hypothetical protein